MINKDLLKDVWKKIDDMVDWVKITGKSVLGTLLELADNLLGPQGLEYLNEKYGDKIPESLLPNIKKALQGFVNDDYDSILESIPAGIDSVIDIKQFPDDFEAQWIATNTNALIIFIRYYAEQKKSQADS